METNEWVPQMLEFTEKDFKISRINIFNNIREKMDIMSKEMGVSRERRKLKNEPIVNIRTKNCNI